MELMRSYPRLLAFLVVLLGPSLAARAQEQELPEYDAWWARDKALHYSVSAGLATAGYVGGALVFDAPEARLLTGAGVALSAGVGKELYDKWRGTFFSWKDLTWDVLGTTTGLGLSYAVDRLLFSRGAGTSTPRAEAPRVSLSLGRGAPGHPHAGPGDDRNGSVTVFLMGGW